jgi:hypothetical protein
MDDLCYEHAYAVRYSCTYEWVIHIMIINMLLRMYVQMDDGYYERKHTLTVYACMYVRVCVCVYIYIYTYIYMHMI